MTYLNIHQIEQKIDHLCQNGQWVLIKQDFNQVE
jgi:hypothetical protein